ncbi:hypothetical protein ACOBQJ_09515 [Pelotomaculum propionicicum]|uniref:hypothetical protein n=1 Tax=Pelotomaculum propionicicum TaxID=258475 RepID=UPI003B81022D
MPVVKRSSKVISLRQRMVDRVLAEKELVQNLAHHLGVDVGTVKKWVVECYSDDMLRSILGDLAMARKTRKR